MGRVQRALISVSDKSGIGNLGRALAELGVEILSTGGTARALRDEGVPVIDVSVYTESPEVMDGRVKTLHPRIHGGILMRDMVSDRTQLGELGGSPIDLVVVNLYPFEATLARGADHATIVENIDIGGPSMVRSAAKNHARVTVVTDPEDYPALLEALRAGGETSLAFRKRLATKAFAHTAAYDGAIAGYLSSLVDDDEGPVDAQPERMEFPGNLHLAFEKAYDCRYGENPHQAAAFYIERGAPAGSLSRARSVGAGGKQLSFNNLVDLDAALDCVREFEGPAAVVVKHTNACGVARAETLAEAYRRAREADSQSAFGGIVALNREVDLETAELVAETFIECVVAPAFTEDALGRLRRKKNLRLLATDAWLEAGHAGLHFKRLSGGLVVQQRDACADEVRAGRVVTKRQPTDDEWSAMDFAWRVAKHVKSNAIVFAHPDVTVGVGAGQMARVVAVELAAKKAGPLADGAAMASDAFFPFADGLEAAAEAGVRAVAQPGGSKRDAEVVAAADAAGLTMVFTGARHFRH
ncbi:MAG: bifunctional phosphoribosylaminoimidazolecarboxamide formyltransferase/IMP cyclohydrolase [Deltaproteobacteria bacterium]|nr:bifunctional phosphoribosylaminoimidazolecarboxamide formyltransferase/IMP cyclohydrolase [Deltaproteobacteria bacterium]